LVHLIRLEWRKVQRHFLALNGLPRHVETHRFIQICETRLIGRKKNQHVPAVSTCRPSIQDFGGILARGTISVLRTVKVVRSYDYQLPFGFIYHFVVARRTRMYLGKVPSMLGLFEQPPANLLCDIFRMKPIGTFLRHSVHTWLR